MNQEDQFAAMLLMVGGFADISRVVFDAEKYYSRKPLVNVLDARAFRAYKNEVIGGLEKAEWFKVYDTHSVHKVTGRQMSTTAAKWVSEYFQWIADMQRGKRDE